MYSYEKIQPPHTPVFKGRKKAISPEPLGSRSRWADISSTRYLPDNRPPFTGTASADIRRPDLPDDDQTDFDSGYGTLYDIGDSDVHSTWDDEHSSM